MPDEPVNTQSRPYKLEMKPGTYFWCACGRSAGQPFCDGSHKGTGLTPHKVEISEARMVAFCGCRHSATGAMCDGTHKKLPQP